MRCDIEDAHCAVVVADEEPGHTPNGIVAEWKMIRGGSQSEVGEKEGIIDGSTQPNSGGPAPIGFSWVLSLVRMGDSRNRG